MALERGLYDYELACFEELRRFVQIEKAGKRGFRKAVRKSWPLEERETRTAGETARKTQAVHRFRMIVNRQTPSLRHLKRGMLERAEIDSQACPGVEMGEVADFQRRRGDDPAQLP